MTLSGKINPKKKFRSEDIFFLIWKLPKKVEKFIFNNFLYINEYKTIFYSHYKFSTKWRKSIDRIYIIIIIYNSSSSSSSSNNIIQKLKDNLNK